MSDEIKTLDLDEMLGEKQTVKVKRGTEEYMMRDISSFSTYQILRMQGMRRKIATLQLQDEVSEEQANELEKLFNDILGMLCPEMQLENLTYTDKTSVLAFYFMEVRKKKVKKRQS